MECGVPRTRLRFISAIFVWATTEGTNALTRQSQILVHLAANLVEEKGKAAASARVAKANID